MHGRKSAEDPQRRSSAHRGGRPALRPFPWTALATLITLGWPAAAGGAVGGDWLPQGPGPLTGGQVEGIYSPVDRPVTGAVEAIVAHPTNPAIVWIGAVNGGIWRTDDATSASPTWTPQSDFQASLSISALELDPTDASHGTLVAGIGRTSSFSSSGGALTGLLRTTDGGLSWSPLSADLQGKEVRGVAPRGSTLVVAVGPGEGADGIFRSVDGGATFSPVANGLPAGVFAYDLAGDPTDPTRLFALLGDATFDAPENAGIFRSDDTGASWVEISDAGIDALISFPAAGAHLAVGTAGPASPNVYAAICAGDQLGGLFRTGNGAAPNPVWIALDLPETTEMGTSYGIHPGEQCSRHLSLVADPGNASVVYVGGDRQPANDENGTPGDQWPNSLGASNYTGRLFRVDAARAPGSQATPITHCPTPSAACGGSVATVSNSAPHADSREMVFDAAGNLLETDDGGVYKLTGAGGGSGDWVSLNGNLPVNEQHDTAYDGISEVIFSGNQDTGTGHQRAPGDPLWETFGQGDGADAVVAEDHPVGGGCTGTPPCSTRYWSSPDRVARGRNVYDSENVLQGWVQPGLFPLGGADPPSGQFTTPLAVNGAVPTRLVAGAANGVYESTDELETVSRIAGEVINARGGHPTAYGTAANPEALYYVSTYYVYVRTSAGAVPQLTDPDETNLDHLSGVTLDPDDADHAFAVDPNQVYRTIDAGGAWSDVTGNLLSLEPGQLRTVAYVARAAGDGLAVGSDRGVFVAFEEDGFTVWDRLGNDLPNAPVYELDDDPADDVLVAGTLGRGAWSLSPVLGGTPPQPGCAAAILGCGAAVSASLADPGATQQIDAYSCSGLGYPGKEMIFGWTSPVAGDVTVDLFGSAADLDLFILAGDTGCDGSGCIAWSENAGTDETVTFTAAFGATYLFSVDDYEGSGGSFTILLDCPGLIFSDGFETGDLTIWSASVP